MAGRLIRKAAPGEMQGSGFANAALAGRNSEFNANVIDFQSRQSVAEYRRRWLKRRVPMSAELAGMIAAMALGEGRQ